MIWARGAIFLANLKRRFADQKGRVFLAKQPTSCATCWAAAALPKSAAGAVHGQKVCEGVREVIAAAARMQQDKRGHGSSTGWYFQLCPAGAHTHCGSLRCEEH